MMEWAANGPTIEENPLRVQEPDEEWEAVVRLHVRAWLMPDVDAVTGETWVAQARATAGTRDEGDLLVEFFETWAQRDPAAALRAAMDLGDGEVLSRVMYAAVYGARPPHNATHHGLGVLRTFDFSAVTESMRPGYFDAWITIMEQWGDVDIGECARFGVEFLWNEDYADRELILQLLAGDIPEWDGDVLDRTFCALRAWAMWRPDEMKRWIDGIGDESLRAALTSLHADPGGTKVAEAATNE